MKKKKVSVIIALFSTTYAYAADPTLPEVQVVTTNEGKGLAGKSIINKEEIERFRGILNSDITPLTTGIQYNNPRNEAGSIDIGIRGMQNEGRVPIIIDGAIQSTHTFRGYAGSSDRTYINSDLLANIEVNKGAAIQSQNVTSGAIGGLVTMRTLDALDIIKEGNQSGLLFKIKTSNNNLSPKIAGNNSEQMQYQPHHKLGTFDFRNGGGTIAWGYNTDELNALLAYSN